MTKVEFLDKVNSQATSILYSNQYHEIIGGAERIPQEIAFGCEGYHRDEDLFDASYELLAPYLPTDLLVWRLVPEIRRIPAYAPEDIDFLTGESYRKYIPPKTILRMRVYIDGLKGNKSEGKITETLPEIPRVFERRG